MPRLFWRNFMIRSGIDIKDVVEAAISYKHLDKISNRTSIMNYIVSMIDQYVDDPRRKQRSRYLSFTQRILAIVCCMRGKFHGSYFFAIYMITKVFFLANSIWQFFMLKALLGITFERYGFDLVNRLFSHHHDHLSVYFPKVTLCDFGVREPNHPNYSQPYTVQCVLPINLFNQQVFTLLWFWFATVAIFNLYSLLVWIYRFLPYSQMRYISRRVSLIKSSSNLAATNDEDGSAKNCKNFVREYLKSDGVFIIRMLCTNAGDYVTTEIIHGLWYYYDVKSSQPIFLDKASHNDNRNVHINIIDNILRGGKHMYRSRGDPIILVSTNPLPSYETITKTLKRRRRKYSESTL
ncbi:hypothetical protein GJ496_002979 [Pomphorhynchus laevis]|nr:hypothetical protein GJ496_002979 [Pomphorhynchus laevis]